MDEKCIYCGKYGYGEDMSESDCEITIDTVINRLEIIYENLMMTCISIEYCPKCGRKL